MMHKSFAWLQYRNDASIKMVEKIEILYQSSQLCVHNSNSSHLFKTPTNMLVFAKILGIIGELLEKIIDC